MHVAPLSVLSCGQGIMASEDAVMVSRVALEALLRSAFPGFSVDNLDIASYPGTGLYAAPIVGHPVWQDDLAYMVRHWSEDECKTETSDLDIQWFDDVT